MMLKKVSTHRQMYSLATNMVNAANLTWNTSGQCMPVLYCYQQITHKLHHPRACTP